MRRLVVGVVFATCAVLNAKAQLVSEPNAVESRVLIDHAAYAHNQTNPACKVKGPTAGNLIVTAGASAIDAYVGYPVATTFLNLSPGVRDAVEDLLRVNPDASTCATACISFPKALQPQYRVGLSEEGADPGGLDLATEEGQKDPTPLRLLVAPPAGMYKVRGYGPIPVTLNPAGFESYEYNKLSLPPYTNVENGSRADTDKAGVFCITGKNWSHNLRRWLIVRAEWPK